MTRRAAVLLRVHDAPWGCSLGALIDEQKHFDAPTRFRLAFRELGTCLGVRVQCHPGRSASPATAPSDKFTAAEENLQKAEKEEEKAYWDRFLEKVEMTWTPCLEKEPPAVKPKLQPITLVMYAAALVPGGKYHSGSFPLRVPALEWGRLRSMRISSC